MEGDRKNARQREVRVFNVLSVHFLVHIEQVRVFELLNWLLGNL